MTQRLPIPGQDDGTWGNVLNGYLGVAHNPDGTLIPSAVTAAGAGTYSKPSSGIPSTDLDAATQTTLTTVASKYTKPGGGIPGSDIATTTITDTNISASAAIARTKLDSSTQTSLTKADNAPTTLAALTDVSGASGAANTQVLAYNSSTSKWVPSTVTSTTVSDATSGAKGIVQLAGDLAGTAAAPTVAKVNGVTLPASAPANGNVLTALTSTTTAWSTPAAGVTLDATSSDIVAGTVTGSGVAGSVGKAADAGHQHPLVAHDHTTTNKGGQIPVAGLSASGTASASTYLRGDGSWNAPAAGVTLDSTSGDIQPLGVQAAGTNSQAAKADHVHAMPRLDQVNAPTAAVGLNAQKITGLGNGTAATDAAAFGQIPVVGTTGGTYAAGNDSRILAATTAAQGLTATTVQTTTYTAAANQLIPADATSAAFTVTLPTAPADKTRVIVKKIDVSVNAVTVMTAGSDVLNKSGGSTSASLSLQNQAVTLQYATTGAIWYVIGDDLPLSQLNATYAPLPTGSVSTGEVPIVTGTSPLVMGYAAAGVIDTTHTPQAPSSSPTPGTGSNGAAASDHVHPLQVIPTLAYQAFTASGTYTVPTTGTYELLCVGGGGSGGGGGSAALSSGVTAQGGGGGGGSGTAAMQRVALTSGTVLTITVGGSSTGGTAGAASSGATGNTGGTGGQGNPSQITWTGGNALGASGGAAGAPSTANSTSFGQPGNAGQPFFQQSNFPGCGGYGLYGGNTPGPIAFVATGGGGGGAASASKGGGGGTGGTPNNYSASGGGTAASVTTTGVAGTSALANSGGGGGGAGGGAPGGAGGVGGNGASGRVEIRQIV